MSLTLEVHTELQCFKNITEEWCSLLPHAVTSSIFQTPAFLHTWWEIYGEGNLHVLGLRNETQELVAVCPFHIIEKEGKKILTFISDKDVTDYHDIIAHKDYVTEIYEEVRVYLSQQTDIFDQVELYSIPEHSPTREYFTIDRKIKTEIQQDVCPIIDLPHHWDTYLESLDRKQRHEVRRKMRKLVENLRHQFIEVRVLSDYSEAIDTFIKLHKVSSLDKASFWDEHRVRFFHLFVTRAAEHGWLRLFFLHVENQPVATMLIFDHNNEYQLYNSGYQPDAYREYSTGQVLTSYTIKAAIESSKSRYNFLRGSEDYKFRLGGKPEAVFDLIYN